MQATQSTQRLSFLDIFRGAFALMMLQGHTFRALLDSSVQSGMLFQLQEVPHSLTGPAFLLGSGTAFSFATFPRWEPYRAWSAKLRKRLLRFVLLLALGYMFHLTYFSLRRTFSDPDQLISLLSMDVLQCIAIGGFALQLAVILLPDQRSFFRVTLGAAIVIGMVSPWVWNAAQHLPPWLGTAFNENWGSLFPLFPFLGFQFAGAAWGCWFARERERGRESEAFRFTAIFGVCILAVGLAAFLLPLARLYGSSWYAGPSYFFPRLGLLIMLLTVFRAVETSLVPRLGQVKGLALIGRESLVAYTVHVLLLYGSALNRKANLVSILGSGRQLAEVTLISILLAGATIAFCVLWNNLKRAHQWKARSIQVSLAGFLVYCLITG